MGNWLNGYGLDRLSPLWALGCLLLTLPAQAIEEPEYEVVDRLGKVEIRAYASFLVVSVSLKGDLESVGNAAFRPLVDYISGVNVSGEKLSMTAPVMQSVGVDEHVVSFMIPSKWQRETLPLPDQKDVFLDQIPQRRVAVLRYGGNWSAKRFNVHRDKLLEVLSDSAYQLCSQAIWARYNPPFWPSFMRRNEVQYVVAEDDC